MPTLADILVKETNAVSAFVILLHEEQEALKTGNADALPAIVEKKSAAAMQITPISSARNAHLSATGLPSDRIGMEQWLQKNPTDAGTRKAWEDLVAMVNEARALNQTNGELIRLRMAHNSQMLEILLTANRQEFYGADGQASSLSSRRIIDSA